MTRRCFRTAVTARACDFTANPSTPCNRRGPRRIGLANPRWTTVNSGAAFRDSDGNTLIYAAFDFEPRRRP